MRLLTPPDERHMTVLEHLEELRARLLRCLLALVVGVVIGYFVAPPVIDLLLKPIRDSGLVRPEQSPTRVEVTEDGTFRFTAMPAVNSDPTDPLRLGRLEFFRPNAEHPFAVLDTAERSGVVYLRPMDPFLIRLKTALVLGILFALPMLVHQIYQFIAPGLLPRERRAIAPLFWGMVTLFPIGAAFAWLTLRYALEFFAGFASEQAYIFNDIRVYLNFVLLMMVSFGVVFELPVVVLLLTRLGVVSVETLAAKRRHIFVALLVLCAIVTPTGDPFTLTLMAGPLYLLFELSLILGRVQPKRDEDDGGAAESSE
ncbi:MAG: twin-arginine translocase subunit TatC [Candidatus Sumerlaeia bacterium]|nr:twin-arginine translocase subunit TatC [Candidatus Sumerlaeia bacterium]